MTEPQTWDSVLAELHAALKMDMKLRPDLDRNRLCYETADSCVPVEPSHILHVASTRVLLAAENHDLISTEPMRHLRENLAQQLYNEARQYVERWEKEQEEAAE